MALKHRYIVGLTAIGVAIVYAWFIWATQEQLSVDWLDWLVTIAAPISLTFGGSYILLTANKIHVKGYRQVLLILVGMYALIGANELVNATAFSQYLASALAWSQVAWTVYVACLPSEEDGHAKY